MNAFPPLQAMPPVRALIPLNATLIFWSLQLWAPTVQRGAGLPPLRLLFALLTTGAALALLGWLATRNAFRLHDNILEVRKIGMPWQVRRVPLDQLRRLILMSGVPYRADFLLVGFQDAEPAVIPTYYTNARPMLQALTQRLSDIGASSTSAGTP